MRLVDKICDLSAQHVQVLFRILNAAVQSVRCSLAAENNVSIINEVSNQVAWNKETDNFVVDLLFT